MATYGNKNLGGDVLTWTKYTKDRVEICLNGQIICTVSEGEARSILGI